MLWSKRRAGKAAAAWIAAAALLFLSDAHLPAQAPAEQRFAVVLDAGHGGDDSGALLTGKTDGENTPEKEIALALSVRLRSLLAARGFSVVTTRESDMAVDTNHRVEIANRAHAQACVSLHATMSGTGVHLYTSSLAPAASAGSPVPWKTAQAAWVEQSLALAGVVNSALAHAGFPVILGRTALPDVDSMTCPAIAVEMAPLAASGRGQAAGPGDSDYQAHIADALAAALVEWRMEARRP